MKDRIATNIYINDKQNILSNPDIIWDGVIKIIIPKLSEKYEYIGLINIQPDNKTMYISELQKSDIENGTIDSETTFAAISSELLETISNIPSLYMFHTHPNDKRACQLPSSQDLAASIYYATKGYYAASVLISTFGIMLYGINDSLVKYFNSLNKNKAEQAIAHYIHDVIAAHESIRSWNKHKIQHYIDFFKRYQMFFYIYPFSAFVAEKRVVAYDLLNNIDHDFITYYKDYCLSF